MAVGLDVGSDLMSISSALLMPTVYGDERDAIIAKWNQLQAFWGTGKGYINQNSSVPFTPENPFCKFKVRTCSRAAVRRRWFRGVAMYIGNVINAVGLIVFYAIG